MSSLDKIVKIQAKIRDMENELRNLYDQLHKAKKNYDVKVYCHSCNSEVCEHLKPKEKPSLKS